MAKKTPFYDVGLEYGAQMQELFGYFLPWEYAPGGVEEHLATRQRASLCDLDYMGEFEIEGVDALRFVQKLFTNDYANTPIGRFHYTAMCNDDGLMMDDGTVWHMGDDKWIYISGDEGDYEWLATNAHGMNVTIRNITPEVTTLALQGPRSADVLKKITDADLNSIRYYHFIQDMAVAGVQCNIARMGYTGEFGYELHFAPDRGDHMWDAIMNAGKEFRMAPCGQEALESLRQEAGYLLVGNDHDKTINPLEAGVGWAVKFRKDSFNGKRALESIVRRGVTRKLVWFKLKDSAVVNKGDRIFGPENDQVGVVTSGSFSPTFNRGIALGYVKPQLALQGVEFEIEVDGAMHAATLSNWPPYDPGDTLTKR